MVLLSNASYLKFSISCKHTDPVPDEKNLQKH